MRAPRKNRNAGLAPRVGKELALDSWKPLDSRSCPDIQAALFTAIPIGVHAWTVKAVSPDGNETRLGKFDGRLPALGAAVLMAAHAEGRVCP